jgi:branched-chain amino acid transport system substrate-binding protein
MKKIAIVLVFQFLLFCHGAVLAETRGVTKDTILMGYSTANTGPAAKESQSISEGVENYVRYVNEQGGIQGRKIKIIAEDTGYSIPRALAVFKKLVYKDGVFTIFGPTGSGEVVAMLSQFEKQKVVIMPVSPAEVVCKPFKRHIFNFVLTYENQIKLLFDYILVDMKAKYPNPKVAIVYPDLELGNAGAKEAKRQAKIYGVELHEEILNVNSLDATSQALSVKKYKPDFVIMHNLFGPTCLFLKDARRFGIKTNFLGTLLSTNLDVINLAGKAANGLVGVNPFRSWYEDAPGPKKMRDITLKLRPGTEKPWRSEYYTAGWVNAMLFTEGMNRAGRDLNNESLVDALETVKNFDPWGLMGTVTWGPDDREGAESGVFYKTDVENGRLVAISDWRKPRPR